MISCTTFSRASCPAAARYVASSGCGASRRNTSSSGQPRFFESLGRGKFVDCRSSIGRQLEIVPGGKQVVLGLLLHIAAQE